MRVDRRSALKLIAAPAILASVPSAVRTRPDRGIGSIAVLDDP